MIETLAQIEKLGRYVNELYEAAGQETIPLFPKVLVRVLPREQKVGRIYTPDKKQNKPTWEAVVLRVYEPFFQKIYLSDVNWVKDDPDPKVRYVQRVECALKPGDHVLFPHLEYGITPISLDNGKGEYRCVPEQHIMARIEYTSKNADDWLKDMLDDFAWHENFTPQNDEDIKLLAAHILKNADIVRRDLVSVTLSGE